MSLTLTHNIDKLYNSIKIQNSDVGGYYKYVSTQSLAFTKGVVYEITYDLYSHMTSSAVFDLYMTSSGGNRPFEKTNNFGYLVEIVTASLNTPTQKQHFITPLYDGSASVCLILKYGTYYVSDINVKPYNVNNFSLGEMELIIPTPPIKRNEPISITPIYISRNNKPIGDTSVLLSDSGEAVGFSRYTLVTGSNLVISQDDNLIEGSLFVGKNLRTGVEISGFNNAMIRSVGYAGFENARNYNWPGFLIYSGSVIPGSGDNYRGVGLELHAGGNSGSLRYRVDDSGSFLEVSGSIYATSGYFSGLISASIGRLGGWVIDSHSLYSDTITLWSTQSQSSGSAIEFYDRNNDRTYLAISVQERAITYYEASQSSGGFGEISINGEETFTPITKNYTTAFFTLGKTLQQETGSSIIFDFASSGVSTPGDLIISGAYNVSFDMYRSGTFSITSPTYLNGIEGKGRLRSIWQQSSAMGNASSHANFISPNEFTMYCNTPLTAMWTGMTYTASDATILAINQNFYGYTSTSAYRGIASSQGKVNDIIHAGIAGNNSVIFGQGGLKVGVYGIATGLSSVMNLSASVNGIAILADATPGTNAKSGVFRFGKFIIGDPFNTFRAGTLASASAPEIVFYVDAQKVSSSKLNPKFGRVGINMSDPSYTLDIVGDVRATGDITAFSDIRRKTNIIQITSSIDIISNLSGVKYKWKTGSEGPQPNNNFVRNENKERIGLIAQDVEKYLPEVVFTDDGGYKSIDYGSITAILIESVKEQQKEIYQLKDKIEELNNKLSKN